MFLKLDFEKAFDKVEHQAILEVLKHKGFPNRLINWVTGIFSLGTFFCPAKWHTRKAFGVWGPTDHLSPLLFVLTVDLLQSIINTA